MATDANPDWPGEPTPQDRLLYGIGRVCQAHVLLDWNLAILQAALAIRVNPSNPEDAFDPTLSTDERARRCQRLLQTWAPREDLRTAGTDALKEAREVNGLRNRVVHDVWTEHLEAEDGSTFNRVRIGKAGLVHEESDLAFVHDAGRRIDDLSVRVNALVRTMERLHAAAGDPVLEEHICQRMLPVVRGESQLDASDW